MQNSLYFKYGLLAYKTLRSILRTLRVSEFFAKWTFLCKFQWEEEPLFYCLPHEKFNVWSRP